MDKVTKNGSTFPDLQPGDVLLYGGRGPVDRLIQARLWSDVSHIEIYCGALHSVASRNGIGVGRYLFRSDGVRYALRHTNLSPAQFQAGMDWFKTVEGQPYNWGDLLRFYMIDINTKGFICSQFGGAFFRQAGAPLFSTEYPEGDESPRDYQITPLLKTIWKYQ